MKFLAQPATEGRLGDLLKDQFAQEWKHFRAAVAFARRSGTRHIADALHAFSRESSVEIIVGIDHLGTSFEGLNELLKSVQPDGKIFILHNRLPHTFHPKMFIFHSDSKARILIGSGNLTEGGLFTNYEAGVSFDLDLSEEKSGKLFQNIMSAMDQWTNANSEISHELDDALLAGLANAGLVPLEALAGNTIKDGTEASDSDEGSSNADSAQKNAERGGLPFGYLTVPKAPSVPKGAESAKNIAGAFVGASQAQDGFVMTLQKTDVGVGQTSAGTSRRSPEIFIPLVARDANPGFWDWPEAFVEDPTKANKFDRRNVLMRIGGKIVPVNMMTWPDKSDFRIRSEELRSAGNIGDILRMEKMGNHSSYDYYVEIIPKGTTHYQIYDAICNQPVRPPSKKRYGYY